MKPTVGRIVSYHLADHDSDAIKSNFSKDAEGNWYGNPVLPAVIVRVWSDTCVNLKVLTDGPVDGWKTSVNIADENNKEGFWSWPVRES
jgi:hypothetical protein